MVAERVALTKCYCCGAPLDGRDEIPDSETELDEAVSFCLYCGAIGVFDEHAKIVRPTSARLDTIFKDPELRGVWMDFMHRRAYLLATSPEKHLRYVSGPSPHDN